MLPSTDYLPLLLVQEVVVQVVMIWWFSGNVTVNGRGSVSVSTSGTSVTFSTRTSGSVTR